MNAITKAIMDVKFRIPPPILNDIFLRQQNTMGYTRNVHYNVDYSIRDRIIMSRVLPDINLSSGQTYLIPLNGIPMHRSNSHTFILTIPKERTQNRSINSVESIVYTDPNMMSANTGVTTCQPGAILRTSDAILRSAQGPASIATTNVHLMGENIVMCRETTSIPYNCHLVCTLMYDDELSQIQPAYYSTFTKLVELATKAYIYNEHIIRLAEGEVRGGVVIGKFKDIIDEYRDAEENYQTFLDERWKCASKMNDKVGYRKLLRLTTPMLF